VFPEGSSEITISMFGYFCLRIILMVDFKNSGLLYVEIQKLTNGHRFIIGKIIAFWLGVVNVKVKQLELFAITRYNTYIIKSLAKL
jgi:hypothetical protein